MTRLRLAAVTAVLLTFPAAFAATPDAPKAPTAAARAPYTGSLKKLGRAEFDALLARPEQLLIVDVRRPDELTAIGGFPVYLNVQAAEIEQRLASIPKDRAIVTVSNHANRALRAGDVLLAHGYRVLGAVGAENYAEEGGTLSRTTAPVPSAAATR